ncbi:MAG: stage V sporulation protein AC [Clostridiales bacterium]|nr:stage V sporulation protein AC [Clostridiales bacterium]
MKPMNAKQYQTEVADLMPKSKTLLSCLKAFWVGGLICCLGQLIGDLSVKWWSLTEQSAGTVTAITLIFLAALLTALGIFDVIAAYAGAGTVVPITGFSNSIAAPAIEYRSEGLVMGVGAKLFSPAGPVLVYGIGASVIVGLISLLFK